MLSKERHQSFLWHRNQSEHRVQRLKSLMSIYSKDCGNNSATCLNRLPNHWDPTQSFISCISKHWFQPLMNLCQCRKQCHPFFLRHHRVSTVAPQHEVPGLKHRPTQVLSPWSLHVLHLFARFPPGVLSFLPLSKPYILRLSLLSVPLTEALAKELDLVPGHCASAAHGSNADQFPYGGSIQCY